MNKPENQPAWLFKVMAQIESDATQCELDEQRLNATGDKLNAYLMGTQAMAHRLDLKRISDAMLQARATPNEKE